jgi:hypothetical protein
MRIFPKRWGGVSGGDGLLCIDKNNDKLIDSSELFGNSDVYGFDMLKSYDNNNDGVIDSSDSIYSSLSIWVDNGNGITEEGM